VLAHPPEGMEVRSLVALYGRARARRDTVALIGHTTAEFLDAFCP